MAIVECPGCEVDIDLGTDESGLYECPECGENFEHIGSKLSETNMTLVKEIQRGSYDEHVIYQEYKFLRNYKWYYHPLSIVLIPWGIGIIMVLYIFWNLLRSRTSQIMIVYIPESDCIFKYRLIHSDPYELKKLHVDSKMKITYQRYIGGSEDNSWTKFKINSSNGEEVKFTTDGDSMCNIHSFGNRMGILLTQVDKIN